MLLCFSYLPLQPATADRLHVWIDSSGENLVRESAEEDNDYKFKTMVVLRVHLSGHSAVVQKHI